MWYRAHLRQALVLGVLLTLGLVALLAIPLVVVLARASDPTATIRVYGVALVIDVVAFLVAALIIAHAAQRAGRGEIVDLPFVRPLSERLFRTRA